MSIGSRVISLLLDTLNIPCTTVMHVAYLSEPCESNVGLTYPAQLQVDTTRDYQVATPFGKLSYRHQVPQAVIGLPAAEDVLGQFAQLDLDKNIAKREASYGKRSAYRAAALLEITVNHYAEHGAIGDLLVRDDPLPVIANRRSHARKSASLPLINDALLDAFLESKNVIGSIAPDLNLVAIPVASGTIYTRQNGR